MQILINGAASSMDTRESALCHLHGVFETILISQQQPVMWHAHMQRLQHACQQLELPMPDPRLLENELQQSLESAAYAIVKIIVFHDNIHQCVKRVISPIAYPAELIKKQQKHGLSVIFCTTRLSDPHRWFKHLKRDCYRLAGEEIKHANVDDGLLHDQNNGVIESTIANLFIVKKNQLLTPILSQAGVKGIMRDFILSQSNTRGISVIEQAITKEDCLAADELFLCNSVRGILPIVKLQQKNFVIGKMTRYLQKVAWM